MLTSFGTTTVIPPKDTKFWHRQYHIANFLIGNEKHMDTFSTKKKKKPYYTHQALVEMRLNHIAWYFIKIILDPTDGSDMSGGAKHINQALSRQRVSRERGQWQELPRLWTLFGWSQLCHIVWNTDDWCSRGRGWRSNPGEVSHHQKQAMAFIKHIHPHYCTYWN